MKQNKLIAIFYSILVATIFALGSLAHNIYDWMPNAFNALIFPINESIWEHLKILFYPTLFVGLVTLAVCKKQYNLSWQKGIVATVFAAMVTMATLLGMYYTFVYGFGVTENLGLHLGIMLASIMIGVAAGMHVYIFGKACPYRMSLFILIAITMIVLFGCFAFMPLPSPIFVPMG